VHEFPDLCFVTAFGAESASPELAGCLGELVEVLSCDWVSDVLHARVNEGFELHLRFGPVDLFLTPYQESWNPEVPHDFVVAVFEGLNQAGDVRF